MSHDPFTQSRSRIRFEWGPAGAQAIGPGAAIVAVVDVLSFTTALTVAADRGIEVFPYRWRDERATGFAAAHRATLAVGRSQAGPATPVSLSPATIRAATGVERLVLPSPNGSTIARLLAEQGATVIGVSLRNARAAAAWTARAIRMSPAARESPNNLAGTAERAVRTTWAAGAEGATVAVVAAGERWAADGSLRPAVEDMWGAGAFLAALADEGVPGASPETLTAAAAYRAVAADISSALRDCASGRELITGGYPEDVEVAAERDSSTVVPLLDGERFRPVPAQP
ncbi:MAG TPA: 2-phosphosulfolactate phosphatase [Actinoplanes sp.]|nr:2-phosphosulfolactate phosphatase [Actinoplanes sp.]